jgi:hypothetical protein
MASALMAAYLHVVAFMLCDTEIYLRMVNKFSSSCPVTDLIGTACVLGYAA